MIQKAFFSDAPAQIQCCQLPNGSTDVWIRQEVQQSADVNGTTMWSCDEAYGRIPEILSENDITANFESYWERCSEWTPTPKKILPDHERISLLESASLEHDAALMELASLLMGGEA